MIHSNDPWSPAPGHPVSKGAPIRITEHEPTAEPKPEAEPEVSQEPHERPRETVATSPNTLARPQQPRPEKPGGLARAIAAARFVIPVVQKALPLLEGNVVSAAANLLTPSPRPVDLEPVKTAIGKLQAEQRTLRGQLGDQKNSLRSIEEELSTIKDGIDRNILEIRELAENQLNLHRRLKRLTWMIFILLALSISFTALVCIRLAYIMRL
jgi:hypothetical protein